MTTIRVILLLGAVLGVHSSTTVTTAPQVQVRVGEDAVLPCDYSPPTSGANNILASLTWSKPNESTQGVSTVASYICSSPTSCQLTAFNNGKYVLDVDRASQGPLTVKEVKLADDGRYTCEVTALVGNGQSSTYLIVTIPPSAQTLADANNSTGYLTGTTVQVTAGVPHTFTCTIKGARPAATARWSIESVGIQADNITTRMRKEGKLEDTISEFTFIPEESHGGKFVWCIVDDDHPALDQQMITSVVLDVNVPPREVMLWDTQNRPISSNGQQFNVNQNKTHTFYCRTAGTKPAATIEWYLNDQKLTTGVVQYDPQVNSDHEDLFDTESSLNLQAEQEYHLENLECRVTAAGVTNTRYVELLVTGPPDDPEIQTGSQFTENIEAHLVCIANNAYPAPSLRWYNNDGDISEFANLRLTKNSNGRFDAISTLTFVPTRVDNQHTIKCLVQHESLSEPYPVDTLRIDVDFCPDSVALTCPDSIVAGQYAVVTCRSASSNPRTGFAWTIGGEVINPTGSRRYDANENAGETTTQSHVGTYSKNHNNAEVMCCGSVRTTTSPLTCNDNICDRCLLDVRYPAELGRPSKTPSQPVEEGTELVLSVPADGNPAPIVVWRKNGSPIELKSTYQDGISKVTFDKIDRDEAGSYYCTSSNSIGDAVESISIDVVVHFPPTIVTDNRKTSANEGQTAYLNCEVDANPRPTITWYKHDSIEMEKSGRVSITEKLVRSPYSSAFRVVSELQIRNIVADDYGDYDCRVGNIVGVDDFNITLTGKTKPEPPYELMAKTLTATSVTLSWQPGFSGGESQWFVISYRSKETSSIIQIPDEIQEEQYTIDGLDPFQEYTFTVCSSNTLGKSEGGPSISVTTLPESPGRPAPLGGGGGAAQSWCNFHGYDIQYNQETGKVFLKTGDIQVPSDLCIKVETNADGMGWNEVAGCLNDVDYVEVDPLLENRQIRTVTCGKSKPYCSQDAAELRFVSTPKESTNSMGILVGSVIGGICLLITIIILLVCLVRTGNSKHVKGPKTMENGQAGKPPMQCAAATSTEPTPNPEPNGPTDTKMVALNEEERKSFLPTPDEGNLYENTTFGPTTSSVIASAPPQSPDEPCPPEAVLYENTKMLKKPCRGASLADEDDDDDDDVDDDSGADPAYDKIDPADCIKNGRSMNADGLIYATVEHKGPHPQGAPPIQTEPSTNYASLDFRKM
ncbi:nephrin-like isoform X2 [Amphiura filiformis]|uniref:nephrin-like isoform X2 n=1 Tax=Amphiura filiformis TaxID=82378 RepID=UPI003B218B01